MTTLTVVFAATSKPTPKKIRLSLHDAIQLAVRDNPNVRQTQLSYLSEKFNLQVQQWAFHPHFSFQASATTTRNSVPLLPSVMTQGWSAQPGASLLTPVGTQVTVTSINQDNGDFNPGLSMQVVQPLMRGFGKAIVQTALNNARDSEMISRLAIESALRNTVSAVVSAYLDIVAAEKAIQIDQDAVKRAEAAVHQTRLFIKAGHKAGNELVTVKANLASAKTQLENNKNNLLQMQYALLAAIGLDPNLTVSFASLDMDKLQQKYHMPTLEETKAFVLEQDIQYQTDQITLNGSSRRALTSAEDNTRWQLNLSASASTGNGIGGGDNAGWNSLTNGINQSQGVSLVLQVPIDDQASKQAVQQAKIAIQQAELALKQEKWNKQTSAINGWNSVISARNALRFARESEKWQEKTYRVSYQKYLHGLIDSLELQGAQTQLIMSQQILLGARVNYIKSLVNVDFLVGHTLKTWDVQVRL
ncbi:MAG: hypothetical protein A3E85_05920 [Gammaproteobacteria bacterium RIFCSPHIGHO2_12_FULL_45_12]|nr:MAG: hypothetical protein A3E85_05920 [Gammaproteobacteria bacterium RIFCSPHIGHO2_12_FULL_45_12]